MVCRDEAVEQVSLITRKKVTFDSNVKTYEHVSTEEETSDRCLDSEESGKEEEGKILEKPCQSKSSSDESSITSSSGSYPPNHRYQNCRDSDDEDEPLDYEDSDLDDEDEDDYDDDDDGELEYEDEIVESNKRVSTPRGITEDFDSPVPIKPSGMNHSARDRSGYVHSVLNPVENLTQWKAVKAKGTSVMKPQKENFSLDQEPRISFSSEPSLSFKSKADQHKKHSKNPNQEMAVDASLSNWLVSSEHTPVKKTGTNALDTATAPEKSMSPGSNSVRSHEDRPILGALTVEEIRQFSASSSPRKSPSRSPDEMAIIGTVGSYWNDTARSAKGSPGASSYKGIPNTTSKYREVY